MHTHLHQVASKQCLEEILWHQAIIKRGLKETSKYRPADEGLLEFYGPQMRGYRDGYGGDKVGTLGAQAGRVTPLVALTRIHKRFIFIV